MALGKEIKVVLTLDDGGFKVGIRDASGAIKQLEQNLASTAKSIQNVENHLTSFGAKAHQVVTTMGMARFALMDVRDIFLSLPLAILKTSGEIERLGKLMEGLSKETDDARRKLEAASNVKFLFNMAQNTPFEIKALGDAFVKLKTGGIDPVNGSLKALVDSVARFGGNSESLKRAAIAMQQMGGKGVVSMEELRQQLGEAVPTAMQAMADGMHMTMAELTKAVSKGTVEAKSAMEKMLIVMSIDNAGAAAQMMDTWVGTLERLKTKWELFKLDIGNQGLFDGAKKAVGDLLAAFNGDSSASLARSIGRGLNDALVSIVNITKKIVELSDTIIAAGKVWVMYWAVGQAAGAGKKITDSLNSVRLSIIAKRNASVQAAADEVAAAKRAVETQVAQFNERIRRNEEAITAEKARVEAEKALNAQELEEKIKTDNAMIAAHERRAREMLAIETRIRSQAMALELQAEQLARSKKAGSGADSRRLMIDVNGLKANADLLKEEREALINNAIALERNNKAEKLRSELTAISTNATNATVTSLTQQNNGLKQVVAQYEAQAKAITASNKAMGLMGAAASTAIGWLKNIVFSMNGLVIAITAAVWAWDYFSSKAKKAAEDAKIALQMSELVERGQASKQHLESVNNDIGAKTDRVHANEKLIEVLTPDAKAGDKGAKKRIEELKEQNKQLLSAIQTEQRNFADGAKQVFRKEAELYASDLKAEAERSADLAMVPFKTQRAKLKEQFEKLGKPTDAQKKAYLKDVGEVDENALKAKKNALISAQRKYEELIAAGKITQEQKEAYQKLVEQLQIDVSNVDSGVAHLAAEPTLLANNKKGPATKPTDAILSRLHSEQLGLLHAKQTLESMKSDASEVGLLREQARQEVALLLENDTHTKQAHSKAQEAELVEAITNKKVLLNAAAELQALRSKLPKLSDEVEDLEARAANGNTNKPQARAENAVVAMLRGIATHSAEARAALAQLEPEVKKMTELAARKDVATFTIENEKRLKDLRVQSIVNTRERLQAEGEIELNDIKQRYDEQIALAMKNNADVGKILSMRAEEIDLHNKKVQRSMMTPIEKMAEQWKDGYQQINDATATWSNGFLGELGKTLTGAKSSWRNFLASMLTDILNMQLKQSFGQKITEAFGGIGGKIGGLLGMMAPNATAQPAAQTVGEGTTQAAAGMAGQSAQAMFMESMRKMAGTANVANTGLTDMATQGVEQATMGLVQQAVQTGEASVAQTAASATLDWLSASAQMAAAALDQLAMQQAASSVASAFANGGIMSSMGSMPLKKYASGGIANSPQLALFGEGSMNEAYVPLPDGRSIPVTMKVDGNGGQSDGGQNVVISITVNQGGTTSEKASGDASSYKQMADRVRAVVQDELVKQKRPGGALYT